VVGWVIPPSGNAVDSTEFYPDVANMFLHGANYLTYKAIRHCEAQAEPTLSETCSPILGADQTKRTMSSVSGTLATFANSVSINCRTAAAGERSDSRAFFPARNSANQGTGPDAACSG